MFLFIFVIGYISNLDEDSKLLDNAFESKGFSTIVFMLIITAALGGIINRFLLPGNPPVVSSSFVELFVPMQSYPHKQVCVFLLEIFMLMSKSKSNQKVLAILHGVLWLRCVLHTRSFRPCVDLYLQSDWWRPKYGCTFAMQLYV